MIGTGFESFYAVKNKIFGDPVIQVVGEIEREWEIRREFVMAEGVMEMEREEERPSGMVYSE